MKRVSLVAAFTLVVTAAAQVPPRFKSGVELVEVSIVARDKAGRPVTDLRQDEVIVSEMGVRQKLVAFERISVPVPAAHDAVVAPVPQDVSSNERLGQSRVFMLVLDALHVAGVNVQSVRRLAREFVERHAGVDDLVAVFSPGALADATEDFTTDKARLFAAIDRFSATKLESATVAREREARIANPSVGPLHGGMDPDDFERARRAGALADVLKAIAANAEKIGARRKALLLFSEGTDYDVNDVMGAAQRYASGVMHDMNDAIGSLTRADVILYAIDPRKLNSALDLLVETPVYNPFPKPGSLSPRGVEEEYASSIRNLRNLADSTGGFAAVDTNTAGPAFERIVEESSEYYLVAYASSNPPKPGEFRRIAVATSRPDVTIVARKGYALRRPTAAAVTPPRTVAGELASLLASPLPKAGLPIRLQAIPFKAAGRKQPVRLVVEILGGALQFVQRGTRAEERLELAMVTVDDRGKASNGRSTTIGLSLPAQELERVRATGVRWLSELDLPAGRHQVRVAARALRTGSTGMITAAVEVPQYDVAQLSMSGVTTTSLPATLMLTQGDAWMKQTILTPPSASRAFVVGDRIVAAVEVYAPASTAGEADVVAELQRVGGTGATRISPELRRGKRAALSFDEAVVRVDTKTLAPGGYVLRFVAARRATGERAERKVAFELIASRE